MKQDLAEVEYQRFWRALQQLGLNAYEARSYWYFSGTRDLRPWNWLRGPTCPGRRSTKCSIAWSKKVSPASSRTAPSCFPPSSPTSRFPAYLARKRQLAEQELTDQARYANNLMEDLSGLYSEGKGGRGTLDFLRIVAEPTQTAAEYRRMLGEVEVEYLEFSRPPYAVDPLDEKLVRQARSKGVSCRLLIETGTLDDHHRQRLAEYAAAGVEIRQASSLPLKLALFDCRNGLIALLDPVISKPTWTSLVFDHAWPGRSHEAPVRRPMAACG